MAWTRFLFTLSGLALALFLALYATGLREQGQYVPAATAAAISLLLAGVASVYLVPYLARRTTLRGWLVKIEYEVTREGLVYLLLIAALVVAALNTGNNLLFIILACLLSGVVVSGLLSRIVLSEVELDLTLPEHLFAEQAVESRVTLANRKRFFPSFSLTVSTGSLRQSDDRSARGLTRQILDRPVYFPFISRRSSVTRRVELTFPRRGRYTQSAFRLSTRFPFGLLKKSRRVRAGQEIVVFPDVRPAAGLEEILPRLAGEMESFARGRGHDLYALRDYQATDSARHVDWKASAKTQQLKVREFAREDERRVTLVFDARLPQADPGSLARFEKAVTQAARLVWHFHQTDTRMEFLTQGWEAAAAPAREIVYPVLQTLALLEPINLASEDAADWLAGLALDSRGPSVIFTGVAPRCVPAGLRGSSHIVFMDSLL